MSAVELLLRAEDSPSPDPSRALAPLPVSDGNPCFCSPPCQQLRDAQRLAAFYKAMHQRARQREDELKQQVALLQAEIRGLRHRLFGRSCETSNAPDRLAPDDPQAEHPPANSPDDAGTLPAA